ncbi:hypothetical protein KEM56_002058 [Ascosphaera pollenicola]|nr:hypothetical protein KEM56_002058 [Ascosphaera pollenicola]
MSARLASQSLRAASALAMETTTIPQQAGCSVSSPAINISEKNSHQGTKSAPPPSPHPSLPPPHGAEKHDNQVVSTRSPLPPSSSLTSAPLSGQHSPAYAAPLNPQLQAYYPPPPQHQAGQPPPPGQDGRPVYVYDQRGGPVNGHAVPPPHAGQPPNPSYSLTAALPMHPRPPLVYQQPPPPAHQYAPPPPPQQEKQHQQGPPPQPSAASQSHPSTQPTPQPPYTSPPLSKPREAVPATTQAIQNGLPLTVASSASAAEHARPHTQMLKGDQPQPEDIAVSSGTSHAGAIVTPPQQTQVPATLQPTSRATPTSAGATTGGPGSGSSSGRGLSVLDLCGPDSNTAPTAKARSATDSDMLNALSRKV